jgi:uncharacterized RDD family membrane protein YckC
MSDGQQVLASRGPVNAPLARSLAAVVYESMLAAALALVTGFLTLPLVSPSAQAARALEVPGTPARVLSACVVFGIAGLYCVWMWTGGRRTLSMKTWRLWLVRGDGAAVDSRTAVIRYLALWIGPALALVAYEALKASAFGRHAAWLVLFNYAWALVDPDRRFLHDRIARTRIVGESATAAPPVG